MSQRITNFIEKTGFKWISKLISENKNIIYYELIDL